MSWFRRRPRLFVLPLAMLFTATALAAETLRVLAWPGYAEADQVAQFERRTGSRVEITLVGSDEALWQKIRHNQGGDFDVFAVNTAELQRYIRQGLVVPIETGRIPNLRRQLPRFRKLAAIPGLVHAGNVYGIPYTYSDMGLIYDRGQFDAAPDSIQVLWDPRYRGKVLAYDGGSHNFSLAAQSLGATSPFRVSERSWPDLVDRLIKLRRNVLTFYTRPEESVELFRKHGVALLFANYGTQQLQLLRQAGADVGYAIPREGALAWLDCWAITRAAGNRDLAHAWIDHMLDDAPSQALVRRQGLANTVTAAPDQRADARLIWLEPVEDVARRTRLWQRIIAGDRANKVLAP